VSTSTSSSAATASSPPASPPASGPDGETTTFAVTSSAVGARWSGRTPDRDPATGLGRRSRVAPSSRARGRGVGSAHCGWSPTGPSARSVCTHTDQPGGRYRRLAAGLAQRLHVRGRDRGSLDVGGQPTTHGTRPAPTREATQWLTSAAGGAGVAATDRVGRRDSLPRDDGRPVTCCGWARSHQYERGLRAMVRDDPINGRSAGSVVDRRSAGHRRYLATISCSGSTTSTSNPLRSDIGHPDAAVAASSPQPACRVRHAFTPTEGVGDRPRPAQPARR
jgi:hypothetical protein